MGERIVIVKDKNDEFIFKNYRQGVDFWWQPPHVDLEYYSDSPYVASLLEYITIL